MSKLTFGGTGRTGRTGTTGRIGRSYTKVAVTLTLDQAAQLRARVDEQPSNRTVSALVRLALTRSQVLEASDADLDQLLVEQAREEARAMSGRETRHG